MNTTTQYTIAIDLGDRRHAICVLDNLGKVINESAIVSIPEVLKSLGIRIHSSATACFYSKATKYLSENLLN